ncbi:MAG: alpha/beta hydrolase [Cyanobacteria bacterium P01_H01_bin.21]
MNWSLAPSGLVLMASTTLVLAAPPALAATFTPSPVFDSFDSYTTINPFNGDVTDIYYPTDSSSVNDLPVVLLLQGALVDKAFYSDYASQVARYGFSVIVPNHFQTVPPLGDALLSETTQAQDVLEHLTLENNDPNSPLTGQIDVDTLGLLGHSFGAAVGLATIGEICLPLQCPAPFERPEELRGGAFFGANLRDMNDVFLPIDNDGIGIALLQGNQDGRALPSRAERTFEQIQTSPRALVELDGVNHFGITNTNFVPGAIPDPNSQTLDQAVATELIARWSGLFLRGTLLDDSDALDYVLRTGADQEPNVVSVRTESIPEPMSTAGSLGIVFGLMWLRRRRSA